MPNLFRRTVLLVKPQRFRRLPQILLVGNSKAFVEHLGTCAAQSGRLVIGKYILGGDSESLEMRLKGLTTRLDEVAVQASSWNLSRDILIRAELPRIFVVLEPDMAIPAGLHSRAFQVPFKDPLSRVARFEKRALDLVIGTFAFCLVLPIILASLIIISLDSRGWPIFKQIRLGVDGRRFSFLKLRTMHTGSDDSEHRKYVASLIRGEAELHDGIYKLTTDVRVTRVGRFLRCFSLDELPQLLNVLRGELSLVGPRPPLPSEAENYDALMWQRLRVKPGITGLWQTSGRSKLTFQQMVELDIRYWQEWSLMKDLLILSRTLPIVISSSETA